MKAEGTQRCPDLILHWHLAPISPLLCPFMFVCWHAGAMQSITHLFVALAPAHGMIPNPSILGWHRGNGFFYQQDSLARP